MPKVNKSLEEFDEGVAYEDPLARYYRMPGVHVKLPSNGAFMPPGTIELTMNGDVPVYPMRAADELLLKSPDALISGFAIEELLKSCVPAIKAPRLISGPDLDVLLLAIRAATYGELLTVSPICPECNTTNEVKCNLARILATSKPIDPEISVRLSDEIVVYLKPHSMDTVTRIGIVSFEESRKVQGVEDAEQSVRAEQINQSMQRMVSVTMDALAGSVIKVVVKEGAVADPTSIRKFIANVSKSWVDKLQAKMDEVNARGIDKHYDVTCANCGHKWRPEIEFNPSTFFASAS